MPDIPFDRQNADPAWIFSCIQSLMCDPYDRDGVRSWFALLAGPDSEFKHAAIQNRLRNAHAAAIPAALVFLDVLRLTIHLPEHASIRKAQYLTAERLKAEKDQQRGNEGRTSLKAVRASWAKFQPVAHFWLAHLLLHVKSETEAELDEWVPVLISASDYLLAIAESAGVDVSDAWRLPGAAPLPPTIEPARFFPVSPWDLNCLSTYVVRR